VKPATVIVNNTKIINQTKEVGSVRLETRSFAGAAAQKVVVNEGPGADEIRNATGRTVSSVSIREVAGRNPVPSDAVTKINESRKTESQSAQKPKDSPGESQVENKGALGQEKDPNQVGPSQHPPAPDNPNAKPGKPPGKLKKGSKEKSKD
jgi:hypothetical protein